MGNKCKKGFKRGVHLKNLSNVMFIFLGQRVISVTLDIVNIDVVIVSDKLISIVYKLKNLCTINKIMPTIIMA